jgi:hypothetical protein
MKRTGQTGRVTRTRGLLALSGGFAFVLLALVVGTSSGPLAGIGTPAHGDRLPSVFRSEGLDEAQPAMLPTGLPVRSSLVAAPVQQSDPEAPEADARTRAPRAGSAAAWFAEYRDLETEQLAAEMQLVLCPGGDADQQVGYLRAMHERGPEDSREAFLRAARLSGSPESSAQADARGVSVPSYAVTRLAADAADPEVRVTLKQLAWEEKASASSHVRGRAAAALVTHAAPDEYRELHDQLWREMDAHVLACAIGAAHAGERELMLTLAHLDASGGLARRAENAGDRLSVRPPRHGREPRREGGE